MANTKGMAKDQLDMRPGGEGRSAANIVMFESQRSYSDALRLALDITEDLRIAWCDQELLTGLKRVEEQDPTLVVTGHRPCLGYTGLDVVSRIRKQELDGPRNAAPVPIVLLTSYPTPGAAMAMKQYPRVSVVSKQCPVTDIVRILRSVVSGEDHFVGVHTDPFGLSPAEFEVLERLVHGYTAGEIADELHLSVHAIRARIRGVLTKTNSTSQLESVSRTIASGVVAVSYTHLTLPTILRV